jgi:hypothetical protein
MRIGWHWRELKDSSEAEGTGDFLARLTREVAGIDSEFRHVHSLPLAQAVDAAWTPDGLSRDDLAIRIGAQRGMSPAQALTVLRLGH